MTTLLFLNLDIETIWGLVIGIVIMLPIIVGIGFYKLLAPKDILVTFGVENRAKYVMVGKEFTGKIILPSKTICYDEHYAIKKLKDLSDKEKEKFKQSRGFFGMHWIGAYNIYERRQQWLEWESLPGGGRKIIVRNEMTPFLFCTPFEYTMLLEEGEDINNLPLNIYFTVRVRPTNVKTPVFDNEDAYGQLQTKCLSEVLLFAKKKTFKDLGGDNSTPNVTNDEFSSILRKLNTEIPGSGGKSITGELGYEILDAKLDKVEIGGKNKDSLEDASTAEYRADQKAKAQIKEAAGKEALLNVQANFYKKISEIPGAMKVEERKATSGLTTLVEADSGKKVNLQI